MIRYPSLGKNTTIGITAPSSGVPEEHHLLLGMTLKSMEFQLPTETMRHLFMSLLERRCGRKIKKNQLQQENEQMNSIK